MVALQSTNRVKIARVREATFGVTPATPAFKAIRETSSALAINPQTMISQEIRSDRQVTDLILVGVQAGGNVGGEMSFATMDDDLEEVLQGTWSSNPNITVATLDTEISDVSATTLTVVAGLGTPFKAGMIVLTGGFTTPANNGLLARVKDVHAPVLLIWGGKDKHVGPEQSRAVTDALREAGKSYVSVEFGDVSNLSALPAPRGHWP